MIIEFRNNFRNKTFCGVLPTPKIPVVFAQNNDMNLLLKSFFDRQIISHNVAIHVAYFIKGPLTTPIQVNSLNYLKNYFSESLLNEKRLKVNKYQWLFDLIIKIKLFFKKILNF